MRYVFLLAFLSIACPHPGPAPVGPTPDADAGPTMLDAQRPPANCGAACTNERGLGCSGAAACPTLCPRLMRNHLEYVLCVTGADTCAKIDACDPAVAGKAKPTGPGGSRTGP